MIIQDIYLDRWDWSVRVFYEVDTIYINKIIEDLRDIEDYDAEENVLGLVNSVYNAGYTFSHPKYRASIIVITKTTSPDEFQSTFDHEKGHLAMHIASFENIDVQSETFQYLVGDIGKKMFKVAKLFMCDCDKHKIQRLVNKGRELL